MRLHKQDQQLKAQQDVPVRHRIMFLELYATDDDDDNACNWNSNCWLVYVCYASTTSNPPRGCLAGLTLEVAIQISTTKTSWLLFSSFSFVHVVAILAQKETCFSHMAHQTSLTHQAYLGLVLQKDKLNLVVFSCIDARSSSRTGRGRVRHPAILPLPVQQICKTTYLFPHAISKHHYGNLIIHYASNRLAA